MPDAGSLLVSLSPREAKYYGVVKVARIALGQQSLIASLGMKLAVRMWTESTDAEGIRGR